MFAIVGLLVNSYAITISSFTLPMLAFVYWRDDTQPIHENTLNWVLISGCVLGSVGFGIAADRFGRRRLYGVNLIVLMLGLMGTTMTSTGYVPSAGDTSSGSLPKDYSKAGSMDIYSWLLFWRFVIGIGTGGECPLTAIIASEFSPTQARARILATVYIARASGIAAAAIVTLIVVRIIQGRSSGTSSLEDTVRAVDQMWRWITGVCLIPAFVTAVMRFTIPESPRFTLDVRDNPVRAHIETATLRGLFPASEIRAHPINLKTSSADEQDLQTVRQSANECFEDSSPLTIRNFFWTRGNWRTILATVLICFMSDWSIYATELNDVTALSKFWNGLTRTDQTLKTWQTSASDAHQDIYSILSDNCIHLLLGGCIAAVTGSILIALFITRLNRRLLTWTMFLATGLLFVLTGIALLKTSGTSNWGINIVLYALLNLATNFGVNALTFVIPAEFFPTKYRVSCHGISTAFGKIGAILGMVFLRYVKFGSGEHSVTPSGSPATWLGYVYMIFAVPMVIGAFVTWIWIPDPQYSTGRSKSLEHLAKGRPFSSRESLVQDQGQAAHC